MSNNDWPVARVSALLFVFCLTTTVWLTIGKPLISDSKNNKIRFHCIHKIRLTRFLSEVSEVSREVKFGLQKDKNLYFDSTLFEIL